LAELDRRRIVLEAELRAYEDALRHSLPGTPQDNGSGQASMDLNAPENVARISAFNRLTDPWRNVLRTLGTRETFRSQDVLRTAREQGLHSTMPNVRSQLTLLTQRGL